MCAKCRLAELLSTPTNNQLVLRSRLRLYARRMRRLKPTRIGVNDQFFRLFWQLRPSCNRQPTNVGYPSTQLLPSCNGNAKFLGMGLGKKVRRGLFCQLRKGGGCVNGYSTLAQLRLDSLCQEETRQILARRGTATLQVGSRTRLELEFLQSHLTTE